MLRSTGIRRPHLSWRTPRRFWEQYENVTIELAKRQTIGANVTLLAYEMNGEMGQVYRKSGAPTTWRESPNGPPIPAELQRSLKRGYYAAVSFTDFEVGRLLEELEDLGVANETAVVLHADHGWKLGEHGDWSKCTNWELDTRVPLIIRAPWIPASAGQKTQALAELVDLFPTLVELAGLPAVPEAEGLEGVSLVAAMSTPGSGGKTAAFSQYPRCPQFKMQQNPEGWECLEVPKENITRMGFSVRVPKARYTEWRYWNSSCLADWGPGGLVAQELYDHTDDTGLGKESFDDFEYENLAHLAAHAGQVRELSQLLQQQFSGNSGCL